MIKSKMLNQKTVLIGLTAALIFVILGVFCFSYAQEMLDLTADDLGLEEQPIYDAPFPDYNIAGLENKWSNLIIGVTSTLLLFIVSYAVAKLLSKKKDSK